MFTKFLFSRAITPYAWQPGSFFGSQDIILVTKYSGKFVHMGGAGIFVAFNIVSMFCYINSTLEQTNKKPSEQINLFIFFIHCCTFFKYETFHQKVYMCNLIHHKIRQLNHCYCKLHLRNKPILSIKTRLTLLSS